MPHSRPTKATAAGCHELRINDRNQTWRIVYFMDADAVVILDGFSKKAAATPKAVIGNCRRRLKHYLEVSGS